MPKRRSYTSISTSYALIIASTPSTFIHILTYSVGVVRLSLAKLMRSCPSQKIRSCRLIFLTSDQLINSTIKPPSRKVFNIRKLFTQTIIIIGWLSASLLWARNEITGGVITTLATALVIRVLSIVLSLFISSLLVFFTWYYRVHLCKLKVICFISVSNILKSCPIVIFIGF